MSEESNPRRKCDCWIGEPNALSCYCETDEELRYSVVDDVERITHSKWKGFQEALDMARRYLGNNFHIWDNDKKRKVLTYE